VADYRWLCTYWDAQIAYPERFVLALLEDARRLAAESGVAFQVLPYHRAKLKGTTAVIHYVEHDNEPVQRFSPAAIVNATGAWVDATLSQLDVPAKKLMGGTKGSHFVTFNETLARALDGRGVYAEAADGRPVFLLPWGPGGDRGQPPPATLVGTTDEPYAGDPADAVATPAELQYLLDTANEVIPDACLTGEDIDMHYSGVRPLPATDASTPAAITRRHMLVEHPQCALPLISIVGGKLTTCRSLAEEAAAKILARLNMPVLANSRDRIVPGGEAYPASAADVSAEWDRMAVKSSLSRAQIATLWPLLGTRTGAVLDESGATSAANLPDTDIPRAVVRWILENEWVTSLNDLVERRLMLLYNPLLSTECLRDAAELLVDAGRVSSSEANEMVRGTIERLQVHFGKQLRG
jgi:glycerol-3-phosphate dehydrogenase